MVILFLTKRLQAQSGRGCYWKTCDTVGYVRIDAQYSSTGEFIGGCNCACPPLLTNPASPIFCSDINYADCTCNVPIIVNTQTPFAPRPPSAPPVAPQPQPSQQPPQQTPAPTAPAPSPQIIVTDTPAPVYPVGPLGPQTVLCDGPGGNCACPAGTRGTCTINCDQDAAACKDALIECNNPGYDCVVNCLDTQACAGSAKIMGPEGGKLDVNCVGGQACEGSTIIDGSTSTDVTVQCSGGTSCKGSTQVMFGTGHASMTCLGRPTSCQGMMEVSINKNQVASYNCVGVYCPRPQYYYL